MQAKYEDVDGQQGFREFWHKKCHLQMVGQESTATTMIQISDLHFSSTLHLIYHVVFRNYNAYTALQSYKSRKLKYEPCQLLIVNQILRVRINAS